MGTKTILTIFILLFSAPSGFAFSSHSAIEATMSFSHWVEVDDSSPATAEDTIHRQLRFLLGPMANGPVPAAPKFDTLIENVKVKAIADGKFIATYSVRGTIVMGKGAGQVLLALPHDPGSFWETANDNTPEGRLIPCTDSVYQEDVDFAYFWSPNRPGCDKVLKEGRDFEYVNAKITPLPSTEQTYPEYKRAVNEDGEIRVTILMGKDEPNRIRSPHKRNRKNDDENAKNFRKMARELKSMGFEGREWTLEEVKKIVKNPLSPYPYVMEFTQDYNGTRAKRMNVRMVFTNSLPFYEVTGFLYFLEDTLKHDSVMIFDGHSGLGLDTGLPGTSEEDAPNFDFSIPQDKYQLFFFNSCSSYSYYNQRVYQRKQDTKYLDIITTGLETAFDGSTQANMTVINAFHTWAKGGQLTSYQRILRDMDDENLVSVTGDEDNSTD